MIPTATVLIAFILSQPSNPGGPPKPQQDRIEHWVKDLADDSTRWNATIALGELREIGAAAIPALESALASSDWQQRQAAASILQSIQGYSPSERMLDVTIEGLRNDALPIENRPSRPPAYTWVSNAADGTRFLIEHAEVAESRLVKGMESDDLQQRLLCATALGWGGRRAGIDRATEILLPHLRSNRISGDATLAAGALYRFGLAVEPALLKAREHPVDSQQQELLDLILLDLRDPPKTDADFAKRRGMQHACRAFFDPVATLSIDGILIQNQGRLKEFDRDTPPETPNGAAEPASSAP